MGQVIAFRPREQAALKPARNGAAEILFFTGVRRQRDEPERPDGAASVPAREQRRSPTPQVLSLAAAKD